MGIGARELLLVLRARDEMARVLKGASGNINGMSKASQEAAQKHIQQGQSLVGLGVGVAAVGAVGVKWLNDSTTAAQKYNNEAALTLTQVDNLGVSLDDVKTIGLDLARTIPVPFEQIQSGLYDIFSSMDVTVPQAKNLLTEFSKAAVAGQTDLQTAGKGTIAILNAWKMPAENVNHVNDVMFKLVQKGVGTYEQFSNAIGRAIPSTVRAGGSIEDLAGMMAFMTRNGLSTAQAATSAGRAFDAMSNPKTEKHMKEIGISVRDAHGEFLPMVDIVKQMNEKLGHMTAPDRAKAMQELFLGSGGTIQARRFFDLAVPGFDQLNKLTGEVTNSSGAMKGAYDTMFKQPQSQMQLMTNKYKAMQVEIGDKLLPIKMKLVAAVMKVLDAWNNLSPTVQRNIVIAAAVTAVLIALVGIIIIVVGGILMLMGAMALAGVTFGAVVAAVLAVIAIFVLLGLAIWKIIQHWDDIKKFTVSVWNSISNFFKDWWKQTVADFKNDMARISSGAQKAWSGFKSLTVSAFNAVVRFIMGIPGRIAGGLLSIPITIAKIFYAMGKAVWNVVTSSFKAVIGFFRSIPGRIRGAIPSPGTILYNIGANIIRGLINGVTGMIGSLRDRFSSITNMIPDWKGPAAVDADLLRNAGRLTMVGYGKGIDDIIPSIKAKLQGFTAQIPALANPLTTPVVLGASGRGAGAYNGDSAGQQVHQTFNIETQEIDPRKHSADLGMMLASRMG